MVGQLDLDAVDLVQTALLKVVTERVVGEEILRHPLEAVGEVVGVDDGGSTGPVGDVSKWIQVVLDPDAGRHVVQFHAELGAGEAGVFQAPDAEGVEADVLGVGV